jgi:2'-hydroxyisoflavone reductase
MRLLILGGTVFLGRALAEAALARGHTVTLFHRGKTNPGLFPQAEHLHGDRATGDLEALREQRWDVVVDTSGYVPRQVRQSAELLAAAADRSVFVSTISVYADLTTPGTDETGPLRSLDDETVEEVTGATYGGLKALCEREVERAWPDRSLVLRPGLIVGPHDPTDRFTYWPHRLAQSGEVLAPEPRDQPIQIIDVRDLAAWIVRMAEARQTGLYNAVGPGHPLTLERLLDLCQEVAGTSATITWADEQFLLDQDIEPFRDLPLWLSKISRTAGGFFAVDGTKAVAAGLTCRPLQDTVRATLDWATARPADHEWKAGLTLEREGELLRAWSARR